MIGSGSIASSKLRAQQPDEAKDTKERIAGQIDPKELGFFLPKEGTVEPGKGRRVLTPDETGTPVVAELHCRVGDVDVVMLPSGQLKSAFQKDTIVTERPFKPLTGPELIKRMQAGEFRDFKSGSSEHYSFLYGCEEGFFQTTRDILDSLYAGVIDSLTRWGLSPTQPQTPLVVLIFPDRKSFDEFHKMPPGVLAYYSIINNFVVLYEDPELSDAAPELALKRAAYTIAHEGVHQILHNVGVQKRLAPWPAWLTEGLPELFCPVKVTSSMVKEGSDSMPRRSLRWTKLGLVNDIRMRDLLQMKPEAGKVLASAVTTPSLDADGYAVAWGLVHYLMSSQPKVFQAYLRDVAAAEPLADFGAKDRSAAANELFVKYWGADFAKLESGVAKHLTSEKVLSNYRDPITYQTHYVVVHTAMRGRAALVTVLITTSPDGARRWKAEEIKNQEAGLKHGFRTQVCETRQLAEVTLSKIGGSR
jgi:hypothetical protein